MPNQIGELLTPDKGTMDLAGSAEKGIQISTDRAYKQSETALNQQRMDFEKQKFPLEQQTRQGQIDNQLAEIRLRKQQLDQQHDEHQAKMGDRFVGDLRDYTMSDPKSPVAKVMLQRLQANGAKFGYTLDDGLVAALQDPTNRQQATAALSQISSLSAEKRAAALPVLIQALGHADAMHAFDKGSDFAKGLEESMLHALGTTNSIHEKGTLEKEILNIKNEHQNKMQDKALESKADLQGEAEDTKNQIVDKTLSSKEKIAATKAEQKQVSDWQKRTDNLKKEYAKMNEKTSDLRVHLDNINSFLGGDAKYQTGENQVLALDSMIKVITGSGRINQMAYDAAKDTVSAPDKYLTLLKKQALTGKPFSPKQVSDLQKIGHVVSQNVEQERIKQAAPTYVGVKKLMKESEGSDKFELNPAEVFGDPNLFNKIQTYSDRNEFDPESGQFKTNPAAAPAATKKGGAKSSAPVDPMKRYVPGLQKEIMDRMDQGYDLNKINNQLKGIKQPLLSPGDYRRLKLKSKGGK